MKKNSILTLLFVFLSMAGLCQEKFSVTAGVGFPELINGGLRIHERQFQFGLNYGSFPGKDQTTNSYSADAYFHFGGTSQLSSRRPWFVKFGLNHFRSETTYLIERYTYLNTGIGREMNISRKFGIQVHAGTVFQLFEKIIDKQVTGWDLHISFPILPSFGVSTFYKI